jgi:AAA domain
VDLSRLVVGIPRPDEALATPSTDDVAPRPNVPTPALGPVEVSSAPAPINLEEDLVRRVTSASDLIRIRDAGGLDLLVGNSTTYVLHFALAHQERYGVPPSESDLLAELPRNLTWGPPTDRQTGSLIDRLREQRGRAAAQASVRKAAQAFADGDWRQTLRVLANELIELPDYQDVYKAYSFDAIEDVPMTWLWRPWIPRRAVTLLAGWPGEGKSLLTCNLAARLSVGAFGAAAPTIMLTAEDALGSVIKPRLHAAGADMNLVQTLTIQREGYEDSLWIPDDVRTLLTHAKKSGAKLVVVDPINAFLPETINSWNDQSVRRALRPLHELAEQCDLSVLVVMHLNKAKDTSPHRRVGGSIGFEGAARSALILGRDPNGVDPNERILAQSKANYGELHRSLRFDVATREYMTSAGDSIQTATLVEAGESTLTAHDLLAEPQRSEKQKAEEIILVHRPRSRDEALTAHEVTACIAHDGHRIAHGTVRNTLRVLLETGAVERTENRPYRYWKEESPFSDDDLHDWIDE